MKKTLILSLIFVAFSTISFAQTTPADSLKQYAGEYTMKGESPFALYKVAVVGDTIFGEADAYGSNKLVKQKDVDTFQSTSSYGSIIVFVRNANKKVVGMKIAIQGNELIGDKKE